MKVNEKVVLEAIGAVVIIAGIYRDIKVAKINSDKELELARISASKAMPEAQ